MKTKNVFTLTDSVVTMEIFDLADKDKPVLLESKEFELSLVPAVLEDGDNAPKSLAAYGLSRIMQDRCSDATDKTLGGAGLGAKEAAKERMEMYMGVFDTLTSGQYRARRASKAKVGAIDTFFAEGFSRFLVENGKDVNSQAATIILQGMTKEQREGLKKDERIAPHIVQARADATQAASELDLDDLLG